MRKIYLIGALLTCSVLFVEAQTQGLRGHLYGRQADRSREILPGGTLTWLGTPHKAVADEKGAFVIDTAKIADRRLIAQYMGYRSDTLDWDGSSYIAIELHPAGEALGEVAITGRRESLRLSRAVTNTEVVSRADLSKAACCDLAGCFGTQASVQAHATNVVTNAQELRLLGLSGVYNQLLFEGMPMLQGAAYAYGVSTYPGSLIENIHISKGTTSVMQGFEGISGQINLESRKPSQSERLFLNAYANSFGEMHFNANTGFDVGESKHWSSLMALHAVKPAGRIDGNSDGFLDLPLLNRYMAFNKWEYNTGKPTGLTAQFGWRIVKETRTGGQYGYRRNHDLGSSERYGQAVDFTQPELFIKAGLRFSESHALIGSISGFYHDQDSWYGTARYRAEQHSAHLDLHHEWSWRPAMPLRYGLSYRYQDLREQVLFTDPADIRTYDGSYITTLQVPGVFVEQTYTGPADKLTLIGGIRLDRHQQWGWYLTPRAMIRYVFDEAHTLRASVGTGWRQVNLFGEQLQLLGSSRDIIFEETLQPERATTWGLSHTWNFWLGTAYTSLSGDFYQTRFGNQFFPDYDRDPTKAFIRNFYGPSRSNGLQLEGSMQFSTQWEGRAAYNFLDVYRTENGLRQTLPFNPRHRIMTALTHRTDNDKWQFDVNVHAYGRMKLPDTRSNPQPYQRPLRSSPFAVFNMQATFKLSVLDIYAGCENLGGFRQANPIIGADNPFGAYFDLSSVWGPVRGREFYAGIRYKIAR